MWNERGDVAAADFDEGDLTIDAAYHDLDLSAIVGAGQRLVMIRVNMVENTAGKQLRMKTKGMVNTWNHAVGITQVANKTLDHTFWVYTDAAGKIEYRFDNSTWGNIYVSIRGWFE